MKENCMTRTSFKCSDSPITGEESGKFQVLLAVSDMLHGGGEFLPVALETSVPDLWPKS